MKKIGELKILAGLSNQDDVSKFIERNEPVIIKGGAKDWPAFKKWDVSYLKKQVGGVKISYRTSPNNVFPDPISLKNPEQYKAIETTFGEYLDLLNSTVPSGEYCFATGDDLYLLKDRTANETLFFLVNDFNISKFINKEILEYIGLWVSKVGTASCIHYDSNGCHNINAQIKGKKKVILFDPIEFENLYMYNITEPNPFYNFSQVDILNLDLEKFPNIRNAKYIEGIVEEGDLLFLPAFWPHSFEHLGNFNVNATFWWKPKKNQLNNLVASWLFSKSLSKMIDEQEKVLPSQNFIEKFMSCSLFQNKELLNMLRTLEKYLKI